MRPPRRPRLVASLLLVGLACPWACRDPRLTGPGTTPADPRCGDGRVDVGEQCDGTDLNFFTCSAPVDGLRFDRGTLRCRPDCTFDTTSCEKDCGNGRLDAPETCDGEVGLSDCTTFGAERCQECRRNSSGCVASPFLRPSLLEEDFGGRAVLGDLLTAGPGDLLLASGSRSRLVIFPWSDAQRGFVAGSSENRFLSFPGREQGPVEPGLADFNGDGRADAFAVNDNGSFDVFLSGTPSFTPVRVADAGCPAARVLGRGQLLEGAAGEQLVLAGCEELFVVTDAEARRLAAPQLQAATVGDFTGDGRLDLGWIQAGSSEVRVLAGPGFTSDGGVPLFADVTALVLGDFDGDQDQDVAALAKGMLEVFERTAGGYAPRLTFPASGARELKVADLDEDGRPDLVYVADNELVVQRGRPGFNFVEFRATVGPEPKLNLSLGDADGDRDLDVAVTVSLGGSRTRTAVFQNRVR